MYCCEQKLYMNELSKGYTVVNKKLYINELSKGYTAVNKRIIHK